MDALAQRLTRPLRGVPPVVIVAIAGAWALAVAAQAGGRAELLHHDALIGGGATLATFALFLVSWQLMTAAMMLPSSLPLIVLFERASANAPGSGRTRAAFLGGYALVWTAFGAAAFASDILLHRLAGSWTWIDARPNLIAGLTLVMAGVFQFSDLKDKCLHECRHPAAYLMTRYRRGTAAAFRLGRGHGIFCLGCCWALMLVAFAAGVANLWWMAAFAALMVLEKTWRSGRAYVAPIGGALVTGGIATIAVTLFTGSR